ncbi:arginine 2-monooxygenase [Streptomyces sp. NPDC002526]
MEEAVGRVAAEMITPYPLGIPVLRYLLTGLEAGMNLPDPADTELRTVWVCADD